MIDHHEVERAARARFGTPFLNTAQAAIYLGFRQRLLERIRHKSKGSTIAGAVVLSAIISTILRPGRRIGAAEIFSTPSPSDNPSATQSRHGATPFFRCGTRLLCALLWSLIGFAVCVGPSLLRLAPRLVWNVSASAPIGLYQVSAEQTPVRGDLVVARAPTSVSALAARRRYLPPGVLLVKRVAAVPGDEICARGPHTFLNGKPFVDRLTWDAAGRPMPWWNGCARLARRQVLLAMADVPNSFDGRYFGPIGTRDILGKARPLWLR